MNKFILILGLCLVVSGCTPEGKEFAKDQFRSQVRDAMIVAANDNGKDPLWKQFVAQKKANLQVLVSKYVCIPDSAKKMDMEVQPIYQQTKAAVEDPNAKNIAQLALLVDDFLLKTQAGDIQIDECRIIIDTLKLYIDKL